MNLPVVTEGGADASAQDGTSATPPRSSLEKETQLLLQEMKVTKGSRFNAAERLRKKDRSNTIATTYLSILVIFIAIAGLAYPFPTWVQNATNLATTILSIFIVVFSLLQYSSGDAVKAELHHRCATEINGLRRKLRTSIAVGQPLIKEVSSEYDAVLQRYGANHEPVDFETYKIEHPNEYPPRFEPNKQTKRRELALQYDFAQSVIRVTTGVLVSIFIGAIANFLAGRF